MDPLSANTRLQAIEDFKTCLNECTTSTPPPPKACGRPYVRVSKLIRWLESETDLRGDKTTQTTRLLDYAYRNRRQQRIPMDRSKLFQAGNPCILVFVILLTMDWGWLVDRFHSSHLTDAKLPIDLATLKIKFKDMADREILKKNNPSPDELAELFNRTQWKFCPAKFNGEYDEYWEKDRIIPINKKELISEKGGTAKLWQIAVLEDFVGPELRRLVPHARYDDKKDELGPRYHFALKVFDEQNTRIFEDERTAFHTLHEHNGLVQYLGGYTHRVTQAPHTHTGQPERITYKHNILLEYGDRDLGLLFAEKLPPVLQDDIQAFWQNLFTVAKAVKDMHDFQIKNDGITKNYSGWHADIKPDNILEIQGKFRLADPGFAKFVERAKESSDPDPITNLTGGTHTFGAPERYPGRKKRGGVNQTTDTWSLGCVFSIAATWVVLGAEGIKQYQRLRSKGIETIIRQQNAATSSTTPSLRLERGDYFHNGNEVLQEVNEWHKYLRQSIRITDKVTCQVLDLLGQQHGMLVGDSKKRMKSKDVWEELEKISKELPSPVPNVPTAITDFLRDGDDQNLSLPLAPSSVRTITDSTEPKAPRRKRRDEFLTFLDLPLKDNYRSYLKPPSVRSSFPSENCPPVPGFQDRPSPTRTLPNDTSSPGLGIQDIDFSHGFPSHLRRHGTIMTASPGPSEMSRKKKEHPQDVFQAREDIRVKESRRREKMLGRRKPKVQDSTLLKYWGDRDLKFVVDNAESMESHWGKVRFVLETLLLKAEGLDPDGVDLMFTLGKVKVDPTKDKTIEKIMKKFDNTEAKPGPGCYTAMQRTLQLIFDEYFKKSSTLKNNKITIIVLTDGLWVGTLNKEEVNNTIVTFARKLEQHLGRAPTERPVSLEFVQFGKDPEATFRLKRLDNELKNEGIIDIVDMEHCDGDVNKMLLGSFVEAYDEMEDEEEAFEPTSPAYRNSYMSDHYSNAEQSSLPSPGHLPRSHTLQTQPGPSNSQDMWDYGEHPNNVLHRQLNSR